MRRRGGAALVEVIGQPGTQDAEGGREAEQDRAAQGHEGCECQYVGIERHRFETGQLVGPQGTNSLRAGNAEHEAGHTSGDGEHQALHDQQSHQAGSAAPEGGPERDLFAARLGGTSRRFVMLAQAIRRTSPTAPRSIIRVGRAEPTTSS